MLCNLTIIIWISLFGKVIKEKTNVKQAMFMKEQNVLNFGFDIWNCWLEVSLSVLQNRYPLAVSVFLVFHFSVLLSPWKPFGSLNEYWLFPFTWLPASVLRFCLSEFRRHYPLLIFRRMVVFSSFYRKHLPFL